MNTLKDMNKNNDKNNDKNNNHDVISNSSSNSSSNSYPNTETTSDDLLQHVEQLKAKTPNTRQLYQQLAFDLFTKFEQTPTPKRLYELAKKGSMSTVVEELKIFWQNLQQNFQQKIERPDIPDALITSYRQSMEDIWQQAMAHATQNFAQERQSTQENLDLLKVKDAAQQEELAAQSQKVVDLENNINAKNIEFEHAEKLWLEKNKSAEAETLKLQEDLQQQKAEQQKEQHRQQKIIQELLIKQQNRDEQMQAKLEQMQIQHKEELHHWQKMFDKERLQAKQEATRFENALNAAQEKRLQLYQEYQEHQRTMQVLMKEMQKKLEQSQARQNSQSSPLNNATEKTKKILKIGKNNMIATNMKKKKLK